MKPYSITRVLLQAEGALLFAAAVLAYIHVQGSVWLFLALILVPDLSMLGYLRNVSLGAFTYNLVHMAALPCLLLALALATQSALAAQIALIWFAHIGMDRMVGYGLKYPTHFKDTHLQRV